MGCEALGCRVLGIARFDVWGFSVALSSLYRDFEWVASQAPLFEEARVSKPAARIRYVAVMCNLFG